ncbi:MAG: phage minor capsid protein [Synergistaceae bacterium]|jgi:hypothetical protein|nr:phage minor capsid protein [Synergistaceae bacterium]
MAVIARKIRKPLARLLEREARDMVEMYRRFAERVDKKIRPLSDALTSDDSLTYTLTQLYRARANIAGEIRRLTKDVEAWEKKEFPRIYGAGQVDALLDMGGGTERIGFARGVFSREAMRLLSEEIHMLQGDSKLHKDALSALENSLYTGANIRATVGRRYDDVFRALGLEAAGGVAAGDETWRQAMRRELDLFERMNIKSFTDKAGRNWKLSNYAEMASRTVPMHVMNVGKMNEFLEYGEDLVVVSDFSPTCPLCAPWGGAVLSISGATKEYPAVSEAEEAGLFHPRCLHSFALYSPEVWGKPDADGRVSHGPGEEYFEREAEWEGRGSGATPGKGEIGYTESNGRIVGKEPFDINDKDAVEALFKKFSEETVNSLIERSIVISPDGFRYDIEGNEIFVNPDVVEKESLLGAIIIHNHPGPNGDSFSEFDFKGFFESGSAMEEVVYNVAGQRTRHRMEWDDKKVPRLTDDEVYWAYKNAKPAIEDEARKRGENIQAEQYEIMRYLARTLEGLRFYVLQG